MASSSVVKNKLKAARDALGKRDYEAAKDASALILEYEPENYNANVFLGLALLELGVFQKSEEAYRKAIDTNPDQALAWQGISKFYERTNAWEKYADTLDRLTRLFACSHDVIKCAETLQKLIAFRRERGTRSQIVDALLFLLPQSPFYSLLSTLPPPDHTNPTSIATIEMAMQDSLPILEEIVALTEKVEEDRIQNEVNKRRMRLGALGPEQLKRDVGKEVWGSSTLPSLYNEILNHPNTSDDVRRATESKLLRHKQSYLYALPISSEKTKVASELEDLVNGVVLLGIPDELAWTIFIEGKDCDTIEEYDFSLLHRFMALFPSLPLTALLNGYFAYIDMPLLEEDEDETNPNQGLVEPIDAIMDAFSSTPDSILAYRILAEVFLRESDHENAIKTSESGLALIRKAESNHGKKLKLVRKAFNITLATSFVHLFPPKHHPRAIPIIDDILAEDPDNISCLMGRAYILQYAGKWLDAGELFHQVARLLPDNPNEGLRAKEEHAWCLSRTNDLQSGISVLNFVLEALEELEDRDVDNARCLWRLGKCHWDLGDDNREDAYRYFIQSLKCKSTYAPAFSSLGIYYLEYASPPDPTRAAKCFQKAFELDAREADSARRLAEGFAEEKEWDLVEVVARRTIDGEGGLDAGIESIDGAPPRRYLPSNAWAWKAVGVVELNRRNYPLSIQAFQVALRADVDDHLSWLRLGEAYSKAGRHVAALKALGRAHELQPGDWVCRCLTAEVQRQIGQFQDAIDTLQSVLESNPSEVGVLMSLGQTHLDLGRADLSAGFLARAEQSFVSCIHVALRTLKAGPGFRAAVWKITADAIFMLSGQSSSFDEGSVHNVLSEVTALIPADAGNRLSGIISSLHWSDNGPLTGLRVLEIAATAYNYRIALGHSESFATGSAWFDLGVALHSLSWKSQSSDTKQKAGIQAFKCLTHALREEPANDEYWSTLATMYFTSQPKAAQHAFIKSLEFNAKSVVTWTNLGLLYLHHGDIELANEALYRAQVLDPDYALAWAGQGLVAIANGHDNEAGVLFEHAVSLTFDIPAVDLEFSSRAFLLSKLQSPASLSLDALYPAFFVLDRYCKRCATDSTALHLFALICEFLGHHELSIELIRRAISILEIKYEESEDTSVERQFTIANSNLARLLLLRKDYEGALESFQSALGLLPQDVDDQDLETKFLRTHSLFGSGLAAFKIGDVEGALALFQDALLSAGNTSVVRGHVTVMLAKTLWATGTEEGRESAKAQLLECITDDSDNLAAINALASMGILTEDDSLVDAALSEILSLPLDKRRDLDPGGEVSYLLAQNHLGQGEAKKALSTAQSAVFAMPSSRSARRDFASLILMHGNPASALAMLSSQPGENLDDERDDLPLRAVAESAKRGKEAVRLVQKAVKMTPWHMKNWEIMSFARAAT